jgi:hypothetical protein
MKTADEARRETQAASDAAQRKRFVLKRPCSNCPFRKGRVKPAARLWGILFSEPARLGPTPAEHICHLTPVSNPSQCFGGMIFFMKTSGAPSVSMQRAAGSGLLSFDELRAQFDDVIDAR